MSTSLSLNKLCLTPQEDKIIQTDIGIQSDIPMEIQFKENIYTKTMISNTNLEISRHTQTELLAWSRDKIAEIKMSTVKPPTDKSCEYYIPLSESAQLYLAESKKKKVERDIKKDIKKVKLETKKKFPSTKINICEQPKTSPRTRKLQPKLGKYTNKFVICADRNVIKANKCKELLRSKSKTKFKNGCKPSRTKIEPCTTKTCPDSNKEVECCRIKEKNPLEINVCNTQVITRKSTENICVKTACSEKFPSVCTERICNLCGSQVDPNQKEKLEKKKQRSTEIRKKLHQELETDICESNGYEDHIIPQDISSDDGESIVFKQIQTKRNEETEIHKNITSLI